MDTRFMTPHSTDNPIEIPERTVTHAYLERDEQSNMGEMASIKYAWLIWNRRQKDRGEDSKQVVLKS